jgi:hypothetical protein
VGGTQVRQSIYRTSTLPTTYRPVKYNPEIFGNVGVGLGAGAGAGAGAGIDATLQAGFREGATIRLSGAHKQINAGTTVRPSIFRTSTLPTINQGTTVLGTVFGGTTRTVRGAVNLGTTVTNTQYNTTGSIIGVGGGMHDYAADVTYSTKPNNNVLGTGVAVTTTGSTLGTGLVGSTLGTGVVGSTLGTGVVGSTVGTTSIMGVGGGVHDYAADVTYSTKPNNNILGTGVAVTTTGSTLGTGLVGNALGTGVVGSTVGTGVVGSTVGTTSIMGVGGGVHDLAADVTYSTKPGNTQLVYGGLAI